MGGPELESSLLYCQIWDSLPLSADTSDYRLVLPGRDHPYLRGNAEEEGRGDFDAKHIYPGIRKR